MKSPNEIDHDRDLINPSSDSDNKIPGFCVPAPARLSSGTEVFLAPYRKISRGPVVVQWNQALKMPGDFFLKDCWLT